MTARNDAVTWYLAQLKPNCASIAQRNLARQGFETFLPLERTTQRKGGQLVEVKRPYFAGYLFVGIKTGAAPWSAIHSTLGIARLVRFGSTPAHVPTELVSELRGACDAECCVTTHVALEKGDDVRIAAGPFSDFIGQVEQLAPDKRAWVLLDVMGKATRVSIPSADLRITG